MNRHRVALVVVVALGLLLWPAGGADAKASARGVAATSPYLPTPPLGPPREIVFYGHAKSLTRQAGHWELRVDPAEFLSGLAATRAAVEDGAIAPGEAVPNDYYTRDEGHRLLTFRVAPRARITVITRGLRATPITVTELSRVLAGRRTQHRLFEPLAGYWVRVAGDTVRGMDQQYTP